MSSHAQAKLMIGANKLGSLALQAKQYDRALSFLGKAEQIAGEGLFSHLYYNIGNVYMALNKHSDALRYYVKALQSPYRQASYTTDFEDVESRFNSQSCYAHTWSNMAVIYLLVSTGTVGVGGDYKRCTAAAEVCIKRALEAMPEGEGSEAYINMNNVMRQMGCKE